MDNTYFKLLPEDVIIEIIMKLYYLDERNLSIELSNESCSRLSRIRVPLYYGYLKRLGLQNLISHTDYHYVLHFYFIIEPRTEKKFAKRAYEYFYDHLSDIPKSLAVLILHKESNTIYDVVRNDPLLFDNVSEIAHDFIRLYKGVVKLNAWDPYILRLKFSIPYTIDAIEYSTVYDNSLYLIVLLCSQGDKLYDRVREIYDYYRDVIWHRA
jgi:hypothetical protein